MNVWSHLSTIFNRRYALPAAGLIAICVAITATLFFGAVSHAAPGVNQTLSFQGRLLSATGGVVPDGYYNMQFKIYQDGTGTVAGNSGGTLEWTENYVNNGGTSGVQVKNGYFSVELGTVSPFGSSVDWNQDTLWLSMNVAGSATACTTFGSSPCTADGEMLPMKRLTSTPFAMNAARLGGKSAADFLQNTMTLQTGDLWLDGIIRAGASISAPALDTGSAQTLSIGASSATAITIGQVGVTTSIDGELEVAEIDTAGASSLEIGSSNATSINLNQDVTVAAGKSLTLAGGNTTSRPASPTEGMVYFDTTTKQLLTYANGKWQADRTEALIVAASNSSQSDKDAADYVADGNGGSANDGDQVQINSALTAASGKKVILLAGTYTADAPIAIPDNTTLAGIGQGTLVQLADLDASINLIVNSNTSTGTGITIQDLKLDGQDTLNTTGTQNGIYFNNMGDYAAGRTGSTIRNIQLSNFRSQGLFYNSSDNNVISGSTIRGMDAGGATLGIYYESSSRNNNATDNVFTTNSYAIRADGSGTTNNSLTQNVFRANSYGIMLYGATNTVVSGNNFDASVNYSVSIYHDSGANGYNNVTGNSFRGDGVSVSVENVFENTVSNNKIHDSGTTLNNNAIRIAGNSDRNTISGNTITDSSCTSSCYGVTITASTADANYLSGNTLSTNGTVNDLGTGTVYANQLDNTGKLINKSANGAKVQTTTNTADAFTVQNAAGTSALSVNTSTSTVLVAGALDTTTSAALTVGSTSATSITIGKIASNIATTVIGTAVFKPTSGNDSTTSFQLQRANGTAMFVADSTNQTITIGDPASANKTIISTSTGAITKYGTARNTKKISLNAEYTGSVLDAGTGSNNTGTMTSSLDLTNRMNYYKWTTSQGSNQSYDVVVQIPLPSDFDGWANSNPLEITTYTSNTTNGTIALEARDSGGTVRCNFVSVTPGSTGTWTTNNSACTLSAGTYTAGDYMTLRIRMQSPTSGDVRIGNINVSYLSKY